MSCSCPLKLPEILQSKRPKSPFLDKNVGAQTGKVTCPRSHIQEEIQSRLELGPSDCRFWLFVPGNILSKISENSNRSPWEVEGPNELAYKWNCSKWPHHWQRGPLGLACMKYSPVPGPVPSIEANCPCSGREKTLESRSQSADLQHLPQ